MAQRKTKHAKRNIEYVAKPIFAFLSTRLIPNSRNLEIYIPRVLLLYIVYNRVLVNVNRNNTNIQACDSNVRSIFFPSTIMLLVSDVKVKPTPKLYIIVLKNLFGRSFKKLMIQLGKKGRKKPKTGEEASTGSSTNLYDETNSPTDGDFVANL